MRVGPLKVREHTELERLLTRVALALVLFDFLPKSLSFHAQPVPNGIARWMDITFVANQPVYTVLKYAAYACLVLFGLGKFPRITTTFLFALTLVIGTLTNSQGAIGHGYNALSLVVLGTALGYLVFPVWRRFATESPKAKPDDLAMHCSMQMLAAVYVIAGITKLIKTQGMWVFQTPYLAVDVIKANAQAHYNYFAPERLEFADSAARLIVDHSVLAQVIFGGGLALELFAFLALWSRWWAVIIGVGMYALHESISLLMKLSFLHNKQLLLVYFIGLPLLLARGVEWYRQRRAESATRT